MTEIAEFVKSLGGLHDSKVTTFLWLPKERRLEIGVKDIYWNFQSEPNYPGATPAIFVFADVIRLVIDVDLTEVGLMIHEWEFHWEFHKVEGPGCHSTIRLSPGGRIQVVSAHIECVKS